MCRWLFCLYAGMVCVPRDASAYNATPGHWTLSAAIGPSFRLDGILEGPDVRTTLTLSSDYALSKRTSLMVSILESPGTTSLTRGRVGLRLRACDLGLPFLPYVQADAGVTGLFNVMETHLLAWGVRLAAGVDYVFGRSLRIGLLTDLDLGATSGDVSAFFGLYELFFTVGTELP